ncbi:MAG TPA: sigma-70 family RNA polymerase sigma factor [Kofleriaceae bacterium]|nr:sigma-70 family RNA polymerase sigma factor [Kofleriaceae bacterium]
MLPQESSARRTDPSFREVYRDNASFVWRVLRRLGVPAADAEDVMQEVFVVVLKKLDSFAHRSSLRTWLYGIAYRSASEHRRRAHVKSEVPTEAPDAGAADPTQPESLDRKRAREQLDAILAQLDDDKRAVFVFYEIEELPMTEVAEIVGCPLQTAYSRLRAAREHVEAAARRLAARGSR